MKKIILLIPLLFITNIKAKEFNVYDKVKAKDITNTKEEKKLDTTTLGEHKIKINNKNYTYTVKDKTPPILVQGITNKTIYINGSYDFCNNIIFIDNYDKEPKCKVEGTYDQTKIGKYTLKYTLEDSSHNKTQNNLIINVIEKPKTQNIPQEEITYQFKDIKNKYKNKSTLVGIDISKWQEKPNFKKLSKQVDFIFIRMGLNNKKIKYDETFKRNIKEAKKYKIKTGIYFYSTAETPNEAKKEAKWIVDNLKEQVDYPIVFDWENFKDIRKYKLSIYDLNNLYTSFKEELNKNGYGTILYSSKNYLNLLWKDIDSPVWLAHYTDETNYNGSYILWQKTDKGKIDGIKTNVDIDILYKDKQNQNKNC